MKCFFSNQPYISASPETIIAIMSKSFNTTATATATTKTATPYCKVCRDAGRPESEYTSHYVKDQPGPEGKVVCPTLLNQACRICKNTGHTSSYCSQYRSRREEPRREERYVEREQPRREERYIEREQPRREERYIEREQPRHEERYIEREQPRHEERYIEREQPRREERYIEREQPRRDDDRRTDTRENRVNSYNGLRDDTERRDREIRDRDDSYHREEDRRSKPWLQAALRPSSSSSSSRERRAPYAHPHGPRVRLNIESPALSASKHAVAADIQVQEQQPNPSAILDVRKMDLQHAPSWSDEPLVECEPERMFRKFAEEYLMSNLTTNAEFDFIEVCDNGNN